MTTTASKQPARQRRSSYLVGKAFRGFLLASVLTATASQVGNLVDGLMLSHFINSRAMSAINIISPVTQVLYSLCILLGVGGTMLAGVAIGNHRRGEASGIFSRVVSAAACIGALIGVGGIIFLHPLTRLLCPDTAIQGYTASYLEVMLPASPLYMLMIVMQLFVTLDGEPRRVTWAVVVSMLVNLGLDYLLIAVVKWEMTGAAVATAVSYLAAIAVLLPHFFRKGALEFKLPRSASGLKEVAAMGLPFGIATALIAVQLLGDNLVAIRYLATSGIVTLSICTYLLMFSMILLTGTLESFQPVASILKGSGDNRGVALVLRKAYAFLFTGLAVLALILILFPGFIGDIFGISDADSAAMVRRALPAYAINIVLQCAVYLLIPVYQLYGHKRLALVISTGQPLLPLLCFWLLSALSTGHCTWINPWWGFALGQILVALVVLLCVGGNKKEETPMFLISRDNPDELFDITVHPSEKGMAMALESVDGWLEKSGIPEALRIRVELGCEETLKNIITHSLGRRGGKSGIDMRISIAPEKVAAVIRDEGRPFNPIEEDPGTGLGLMLVKKTCDGEEYSYIFHQNVLTVTWNR